MSRFPLRHSGIPRHQGIADFHEKRAHHPDLYVYLLARDVSDDIVLLRDGQLSYLDAADMQDEQFEAAVIEALKAGDKP